MYSFNLPAEEEVILRNRTITTYYAQLYKNEPDLYKWAGMAAFASFHIGEKLKMWDWKTTRIKTFPETCQNQNQTLEDDFQVIRIINNRIFSKIGTIHLAFNQMEYFLFREELIINGKHEIIIAAFDKLNEARTKINSGAPIELMNTLIWEANTEILWHEQYMVVQPMFNKLSTTFSSVMSFMASFDYNINHKKTNWKLASRFISFMFTNGLSIIRKNYYLPNIINFDHRWFWISEDLIKKWQNAENDKLTVSDEINFLSRLEKRNLSLK